MNKAIKKEADRRIEQFWNANRIYTKYSKPSLRLSARSALVAVNQEIETFDFVFQGWTDSKDSRRGLNDVQKARFEIKRTELLLVKEELEAHIQKL